MRNSLHTFLLLGLIILNQNSYADQKQQCKEFWINDKRALIKEAVEALQIWKMNNDDLHTERDYVSQLIIDGEEKTRRIERANLTCNLRGLLKSKEENSDLIIKITKFIQEVDSFLK